IKRPGKRFQPQSSYPRLLDKLIPTMKMKDVHLYIHSRRVQHFTHLFTRALNLTHEQAQMIELAALFHDIGKIGLPDALIQKATYLTLEEYEMVKKHPVYSALILRNLGMPDDVVEAVYHHHEHWNGCGYPDRISGEDI